jgi:hypothetical protein
MAGPRDISDRLRGSTTAYGFLIAALGLALTAIAPAPLSGQPATSTILAPGNAAVTGFSGFVPPPQIPPGVDPAERSFVDLDGSSLRIVDLQHMGGRPAAQLVAVPKPFTVMAAQIGQVFGIALDDAMPPNIYVAASSAYGLPIVAPGPDGKLQHIKVGAANARFMPGLWGPASAHGGPGSIWKIDGVTGAVSLFANVMTDGKANSGPALGALAFDPDSKSLFISDRETGIIHRFSMSGVELGRYDHGVTGRGAQGLPPVAWNPHRRLDITSQAFDSGEPATWMYAVPERRVFGLAIFHGRLYYAVADGLQIWSVGLKPDGSFDDDAIIELAVPPAAGPTEISQIAFDEQGRMLLAERPAATGAFDFEALAYPGIGRVLRYAVVGTAAGGRRIWQQVPDEFSIGFAGDQRNGNGGVAVGYRYDHKGQLARGSCGGFLWVTGEQLRKSADAALAIRLNQSGPADVDGLQGNGEWLVRTHDELPLESYFIDYDDQFADDAARGYLGQVAIQRLCSPAQPAGALPFGGGVRRSAGGPSPPGGSPPAQKPPGTKPPPTCPPGQVRRASTGACEPSCARPGIQIGATCCMPSELAVAGVCSNSSCGPGQTAIGPSNFCCNSSQVYTGAGGAPACCSGTVSNGQCRPIKPPGPTCPPGSTDPKCCASGYLSTGSACCLKSQMTSTGICCPSGQQPSGLNKAQCKPAVQIPLGPQCCSAGFVPVVNGSCCPIANVTTTGVCCTGPVDPNDRTHCPEQIQSITKCAPGYTKIPDGSCCNNRYVSPDRKSCRVAVPPVAVPPPVIRRARPCPRGQFRDNDGDCARRIPRRCGPGRIRNRFGECVRMPRPCPPGMVRTPRGFCVRIPPRFRERYRRPFFHQRPGMPIQ